MAERQRSLVFKQKGDFLMGKNRFLRARFNANYRQWRAVRCS